MAVGRAAASAAAQPSAKAEWASALVPLGSDVLLAPARVLTSHAFLPARGGRPGRWASRDRLGQEAAEEAGLAAPSGTPDPPLGTVRETEDGQFEIIEEIGPDGAGASTQARKPGCHVDAARRLPEVDRAATQAALRRIDRIIEEEGRAGPASGPEASARAVQRAAAAAEGATAPRFGTQQQAAGRRPAGSVLVERAPPGLPSLPERVPPGRPRPGRLADRSSGSLVSAPQTAAATDEPPRRMSRFRRERLQASGKL